MKCPHCLVSFHEEMWENTLARQTVALDAMGAWSALWTLCPTCNRIIIFLRCRTNPQHLDFMVHPKGISRSPLPPEVPKEFADDYKEACLVLDDSAKASAALGRRCLQNLLHNKLGITNKNLSLEIDTLLQSKQLPQHLAEDVDGIRNIGNFATHPIKSTNSGEILDVEPGESEWLLNTLEGLFDFLFVQPAEAKKKRDALNAKLKDADKPPMK